MKLYRGQRRGAPVGEWWTTSRDEAREYAPAGDWEILYFSADRRILKPFVVFEGRLTAAGRRSTEYRIPFLKLVEMTLAVRVVEGFVRIPLTGSAFVSRDVGPHTAAELTNL